MTRFQEKVFCVAVVDGDGALRREPFGKGGDLQLGVPWRHDRQREDLDPLLCVERRVEGVAGMEQAAADDIRNVARAGGVQDLSVLGDDRFELDGADLPRAGLEELDREAPRGEAVADGGVGEDRRGGIAIADGLQRFVVDVIGMLVRQHDRTEVAEVIGPDTALQKRELAGVEEDPRAAVFDEETGVNVFLDAHGPESIRDSCLRGAGAAVLRIIRPDGRDVACMDVDAVHGKSGRSALQSMKENAMLWTTSRVVEWKEMEAQALEIPLDGTRDLGQRNCEPTYAEVFAGHGRTGATGCWSVNLGAISCLRPAPGGDRRPSIVATPTTDVPLDVLPRPFTLVATIDRANVTIWSFDPAGQMAPHVEFSWHVIVEGTLVGDAGARTKTS
jgi:hypothetical protein